METVRVIGFSEARLYCSALKLVCIRRPLIVSVTEAKKSIISVLMKWVNVSRKLAVTEGEAYKIYAIFSINLANMSSKLLMGYISKEGDEKYCVPHAVGIGVAPIFNDRGTLFP